MTLTVPGGVDLDLHLTGGPDGPQTQETQAWTRPPGLLLLNLMGSQLNRQIPVLLSISALLEGAEFRRPVYLVMTAVLVAVSWWSVL